MLGLAAFGAVPFGGVPSTGAASYFLTVSDAVTITESRTALIDFSGVSSDSITIVDGYTSPNAILNTETIDVIVSTDSRTSTVVFPISVSDVLSITEETDFTQGQVGEFHLSGEATLEFVGTTTFIDMIEQGEAELGIAAEIRTRSL